MQAVEVNGKPHAAFRPMVESLGLDFATQLRKLKSKSWATIVNLTTVSADGKPREMVGIDRRTTGMWLATLDENRVHEDRRFDLRAYQAEAADALDAYFHDGGAINPSATLDQLDAITARATAQAGLIAAFKGIIDQGHLEAKARIVLARGLGEAPELDPATRPLYTQTYLEEKGLKRDAIRSLCGNFGKRVKAAYIAEHGHAPGRQDDIESANGTIRNALAYTEADRPLMDSVWNSHYAAAVTA